MTFNFKRFFMKKFTILLVTLFAVSCATNTFAKKNRTAPLEEVRQGVEVENFTEGRTEFPKYPGGEYALASHFRNAKLIYSHGKGGFDDGLELAISFNIKEDGSLEDIKVMPMNKPKLDDSDRDVIHRVSRSIEKLENWSPASVNDISTKAKLSMTLVVYETYLDARSNGGIGVNPYTRP